MPDLAATPEPEPRTYPADEPGVIDLGSRHFLLPTDGAWLWWHDCPAVAHPAWGWFGQRSDGRASGHVITATEPMTVQGSLVCLECGDHGFIREGRWERA
jgi:hypothetical protein